MKTIRRNSIASAACFSNGDAAPPARVELPPAGKTVHLQGRQHLRLCDAAGWTISALNGSVWLTQDGDIRDVVLQAGDSFTLDRNGPALLSALGDARLRMTHPQGRIAPAWPAVRPLLA